MLRKASISQHRSLTVISRCGSACVLVEYPAGLVLDASVKARFVRDLIAAKDLMT